MPQHKEPRVRIAIFLPSSLKDKLEATAKHYGWKMNDLAESAIALYLGINPQLEALAEKERVSPAAFIDIAIDKYLGEKEAIL